MNLEEERTPGGEGEGRPILQGGVGAGVAIRAGHGATSMIRWARAHAPMRAWALLFLLATAMMVVTMKNTDGFVPDSRYYVAMTYDWAGWSQEGAAEVVRGFTDQRGWAPLDADTLFGWDLVEPRVVYSALSVPFVVLFGVQGMYIVPFASMLFVVLGTFGLAAGRFGAAAAAIPSVLVCCSFYMLWYGSAMLTEGLAAAIGTGILMTLPLDRRRRGRAVVTCGVLILILAFTRQAALLPAAGIFTAWAGAAVKERSARNTWLPFALTATGVALSTQLLQSRIWSDFSVFNYYKQKTGSETTGDAVRAIPDAAHRILSMDADNYIARDRPMLVLLSLSVVATVLLWHRVEAHLMVGAGAAAFALNILNTTPTAFRYAMPILSFMMLGVAALGAWTSDAIETSRPPNPDDIDTSAADVDHTTSASPTIDR